MRRLWPALLGAIILVAGGCSPGKSTVSGTVKFDGTPVPEGQISFQQKSGVSAGATITNGSYSLQAEPGDYRVEINASKKVSLPAGQVGASGEKEEMRQYIPEKYNGKSDLKATIPSSGPVNFDLKSK